MKNEDIVIYVDSRETSNFSILRYFNENNIKWKCKKLDFGDYSLEFNGISYEKRIAIERKGSLDELAGNFTRGRERFAREFERAMKEKCKMHLMIENGSWEAIANHEYRSLFSPGAYKASLESWSYKYFFDINFVKKNKAGEFIYNTLASFIPF